MESMKQKRFDLTYRRLQRGGVGAYGLLPVAAGLALGDGVKARRVERIARVARRREGREGRRARCKRGHKLAAA